MSEVTHLLDRAQRGDPKAGNELLPLVNEAMDKLTGEAPEKAELVKLRYFTGLSIPDAAEALGISEATAKRHWAFARAWLFAELKRMG